MMSIHALQSTGADAAAPSRRLPALSAWRCFDGMGEVRWGGMVPHALREAA
jgi:hypothetical protein